MATMTYTNLSTGDATITDNKYSTNGQSFFYKFNPPSEGYYRLCYIVEGSNGAGYNEYLNYVSIRKVNTTSYIDTQISSNMDGGPTKTGCYYFGQYLTTDDSVTIYANYYDGNSTYWFEKTNDVVNVSDGYRYKGTNPNNYVWFNNELWRIIGVFDDNYHGKTGKNLVKILRNDPLGTFIFDKNENNVFADSDLKILLNDYYYNKADGTGSGHCYYTATAEGTCDFRNIGIKKIYRNFIENATWRSGEVYSYFSSIDFIFGSEISGPSIDTNTYIGLMYASDYGLASYTDCPRTTIMNSEYYENVEKCDIHNWMYDKRNGLLITRRFNYLLSIYDGYGYLSTSSTTFRSFVRPTLYLKSDVYKIGGSGTIDDPYIIGM